MKELLFYIVSNLVEHPESVSINEVETEDAITLELKVEQSDMGKVIGRQGRIAKAIRTLVKSAAAKSGKKVTVEILD